MPKRLRYQPEEVTLAKEEEAFKLRTEGWTQQRIAQKMGVSQCYISKMLTRVLKRYTKNFMEHVATVKAEQVAMHNRIVDEALTAWEKSKGIQKVVKNKAKGVVNRRGIQETVSGDTTEENKQLFGDTKYLDSSMRAMEHIRKIVGIGSEDEEAQRDPIFGSVEFKIVDKRSIGDEGAKGDI
jgi:predicted transcriptional regulator